MENERDPHTHPHPHPQYTTPKYRRKQLSFDQTCHDTPSPTTSMNRERWRDWGQVSSAAEQCASAAEEAAHDVQPFVAGHLRGRGGETLRRILCARALWWCCVGPGHVGVDVLWSMLLVRRRVIRTVSFSDNTLVACNTLPPLLHTALLLRNALPFAAPFLHPFKHTVLTNIGHRRTHIRVFVHAGFDQLLKKGGVKNYYASIRRLDKENYEKGVWGEVFNY